jgi:hypothetical protein
VRVDKDGRDAKERPVPDENGACPTSYRACGPHVCFPTSSPCPIAGFVADDVSALLADESVEEVCAFNASTLGIGVRRSWNATTRPIVMAEVALGGKVCRGVAGGSTGRFFGGAVGNLLGSLPSVPECEYPDLRFDSFGASIRTADYLERNMRAFGYECEAERGDDRLVSIGLGSCASDDATCATAATLTLCEYLLLYSSTGANRIDFVQLQDIRWEADCKVTRGDLFRREDVVVHMQRLQYAGYVVALVACVVLSFVNFVLAILRGCTINYDRSCTSGCKAIWETPFKLTKLIMDILVLATVGAQARFFSLLSSTDCSDDVTSRALRNVGVSLDDAYSATTRAIIADFLLLIYTAFLVYLACQPPPPAADHQPPDEVADSDDELQPPIHADATPREVKCVPARNVRDGLRVSIQSVKHRLYLSSKEPRALPQPDGPILLLHRGDDHDVVLLGDGGCKALGTNAANRVWYLDVSEDGHPFRKAPTDINASHAFTMRQDPSTGAYAFARVHDPQVLSCHAGGVLTVKAGPEAARCFFEVKEWVEEEAAEKSGADKAHSDPPHALTASV